MTLVNYLCRCATVTSSLRADSYSREQLAQGFSDWHKPLEALVLHSEGRAADMAVCDAYSTITKLAGVLRPVVSELYAMV